MLLSFNWLRELTPYEGDVETLADRLTMLGLEVEDVTNPFSQVASLVVGHVLERIPHPQADRLSLCLVDVGQGQPLPIVCGAPNVATGQKVVVARVGTELPGGTIKKAKIRGQESLGMICSEKEIGLGDDTSGIMVLDSRLPAGKPLAEALGLDTVVLDVSITPNRADCLSVQGLAREVATAFGLPFSLAGFNLVETGPDCAGQVDIRIDDPRLCPVYQARIIRGVTVGRSPAWMRYRLLASGMRSINNIVDVTNYVLLETGQPQHAFDRTRIAGNSIRVALASGQSELITLDNQMRRLMDSDLLIWDGEKPVALAGVMGGANSEVSADSRDVLLECAVFHPGTIRKTARRLGLSSEASYRFERGVDQPGSRRALDRAAALMAELAGGQVLPRVASCEPAPWKTRVIPFRRHRASQLLGIPVDQEFCRRTLTSLGCSVDSEKEDWTVTPPSYRLDLEREVDLIEEVARVFGVDRIPAHLPRITKPLAGAEAQVRPFDFIQSVKDWARGLGLRETINYSFVGGKELDALGLSVTDRIMVCNPLSSDQDTLRTVLAPGLLQNVRQNANQGQTDLRLFEVARAFFSDTTSETSAREQTRLGLLLSGQRNPGGWPWNREPVDFGDLKGLVEHLLDTLKLTGAAYTVETGHPFLEPCVAVSLDRERVGLLGKVDPDRADAYNARGEIWLAELDLDVLRQRTVAARVCFKPLAKFPPVRRDVTFFSPKTLRLESFFSAIQVLRPSILEDMTLIDIYQPDNPDEHNLTFRLTYRHPDKTLTDSEVDKVHGHLTAGLAQSLSVRF